MDASQAGEASESEEALEAAAEALLFDLEEGEDLGFVEDVGFDVTEEEDVDDEDEDLAQQMGLFQQLRQALHLSHSSKVRTGLAP